MENLSPYIVAPAVGWLVAQGLKYVIMSFKGRKLKSVRQLYLSGSMPSAHSATTVSLLVVIALRDGIESSIFGLALLFTAVVMYDAVMVRRSSGEQGQALTELIKEKLSKVRLPRVAKGHTPIEVVGGALVGLVVGVSISSILL